MNESAKPTGGMPTRLAVSVPDLAVRLGVHPGTLRNAARRGDLKTVRIGRRMIVPTHEVDRILGVVA